MPPDVHPLPLADFVRHRTDDLPARLSRPDNAHWYRKLVTGNLLSVFEQAFPLAYQYLGAEVFEKIGLAFLKEHPSHTPQIWKAPAELVDYIQQSPWPQILDAPWLPDLLLFEWAEIEVHTQTDQPLPSGLKTDLQTGRLVLNPYLNLLQVDWPVHQPRPASGWSTTGAPWFLLVYRHTATDEVGMLELSALHTAALEYLSEHPATLAELEAHLLTLVPADPAELHHHLLHFFHHLLTLGALLGTL